MKRSTEIIFTTSMFVGLAFGIAVGPLIAPANATTINEDDPGWSCVDDGNRICGPGNAEGKPAACYDEGGVIVALWPCHVVVNPDGSSDAYTGLTTADDNTAG